VSKHTIPLKWSLLSLKRCFCSPIVDLHRYSLVVLGGLLFATALPKMRGHYVPVLAQLVGQVCPEAGCESPHGKGTRVEQR
jgi:hypothetical protein